MAELTRLQMAERVKALLDQALEATDDFDDEWRINHAAKLLRERAHAAIDALATVEAGSEAPNGWELVPLQATDDMRRAGLDVISNRKAYGTMGHTAGQMMNEEWIAMVHAAPEFTAAPAEGGGASDPYLQTR